MQCVMSSRKVLTFKILGFPAQPSRASSRRTRVTTRVPKVVCLLQEKKDSSYDPLRLVVLDIRDTRSLELGRTVAYRYLAVEIRVGNN